MKINNINKILLLNNSYQIWTLEDKMMKLSQSKLLLDKFCIVYEREKRKIPYRLNLLDDLTTNENAHNKFLIRLLQYKPAFINFISYINNSSPSFFFDVNVIDKPIFTYEKMRIDGLIKENNKFAIIIENKIHSAVEQEQQIGRYIDKCRYIGFKVDQIFILYLTKSENDIHSSKTWGSYKQEDFYYRYCKLSYKTEILNWLESYLKDLAPIEKFVKSAAIQYIDHLKHFFNSKEIYSDMNSEIQNFLTSELNLGVDKAKNIEVVNTTIKEINELNAQLKELAKNSTNDFFKELRKNIDEKLNFEDDQKFILLNSSFLKTGVILKYKECFFSISIEYNYNSIYYGIGRHYASENLHPEIKDILESLVKIEGLKEEISWWYGWKHTSFRDAYFDFEYLLKIVLERINSMK